MPYSSPEGKDWAKAIYDQVQPETVVDVGPGAGKWCSLMKRPNSHWTAIEIFAPYVDKFKLKNLYDEIIIADACDVPLDSFDVDLVILGDVIEHIERDKAVDLLERIKSVANNILLATPIVDFPQGEYMNNIHETHVDQWYKKEMDEHLPGAQYTEGKVVGTWWWAK